MSKKTGGIVKRAALMLLKSLAVVFVALFALVTSRIVFGKDTSITNRNEIGCGSVTEPYTILESSGGTYLGPMVDLVYSGEGEFQYIAGGTYEGSFSDSARSGTGTFTWSNGDTFTGEWKDDQMVSGSYCFSDGRTYTGTFELNRFADGNYVVDRPSVDSNLERLSATLLSGVVTELDIVTMDGASYSGAINGEASIVYPSGSTYTGSVADGKRSGQGEYVWIEDGTAVASYRGQWTDDVMMGEGTYYYTADEYPCIQGRFIKGKPDGQATYSKEEGNTFTTTWSNGSCVSVVES